MEKLAAFWNLLRKGEEVSNVEAWKTRHMTVNAVGGFILALAALGKAYGYALPIDDDSAMAIAGGCIAVANIVLTAISSKRAGILPAKPGAADEKGSS